jgi:hypothetical protein
MERSDVFALVMAVPVGAALALISRAFDLPAGLQLLVLVVLAVPIGLLAWHTPGVPWAPKELRARKTRVSRHP